MKNSIIIIVLLFVSFFANAQTNTGATLTVSNKVVSVMQGANGGLYYINGSGNKSYLTNAQKTKVGTVTTTVQAAKVSVPTQTQLQAAHDTTEKQATLIDNGTTVIYHGVTFTVQTGARGGRYFEYINSKGNLKKEYLTR